MSSEKPDTVPGLGFKDKAKALETIKILEGRDPDYQKLAIKGLIGRAKRTLTLTKDKEKLGNINTAVATFEKWLSDYELNNLSAENRPYLPIATVKLFQRSLGTSDSKAQDFVKAYDKVNGEYKHLRTVASGDGGPTWDIARNTALKALIKPGLDLWKDDLPTDEHVKLILWAYSPDAAKIKKNIDKIKEKLGKKDQKEEKKDRKRKSGSESDEDSDEAPVKKSRKSGKR